MEVIKGLKKDYQGNGHTHNGADLGLGKTKSFPTQDHSMETNIKWLTDYIKIVTY